MGSYSLSELGKKVRVVMDKNMTSTALSGLGDVDTLSVNDIIKDSIPRAIRYILQIAPLYLINDETSTGGTGVVKNGEAKAELTMKSQGDGYVGSFKLPDDFLRLVSVRMSDWKRSARAITEDDAEYFEQLSEFAGIRGNPNKPIAALVQGSDGLYLELYSSESLDATIKWFRYIAMPETNTENGKDDSTFELPSKLVPSIVYMSASLSCEILGENNQSAALRRTAFALADMTNNDTTTQTQE